MNAAVHIPGIYHATALTTKKGVRMYNMYEYIINMYSKYMRRGMRNKFYQVKHVPYVRTPCVQVYIQHSASTPADGQNHSKG